MWTSTLTRKWNTSANKKRKKTSKGKDNQEKEGFESKGNEKRKKEIWTDYDQETGLS